MSNNKTKVIFENYDGVELREWLRDEENRKKIKDMRILYVVKANIDKKLFKFGIGGNKGDGEGGGENAYGRLHQYVNYYGVSNKDDKCKGIKLYMIIGNKYNKDIKPEDSAVAIKEKYLINQLKGDTDKVGSRGNERVNTNIRTLFRLIQNNANKTDEDIELERRKSERNKQAKLTTSDKVLEVTGHDTPKKGKGKTLFRTRWSRPYILTEKDKKGKKLKETKVFTTDEFYHNLIDFKGGEDAVTEYIESNDDSKFNI